jgi:hypothetical protein
LNRFNQCIDNFMEFCVVVRFDVIVIRIIIATSTIPDTANLTNDSFLNVPEAS